MLMEISDVVYRTDIVFFLIYVALLRDLFIRG